MLPLVSVCIPAYNHEKYINDCLYSIINQTYRNMELIIIDDGSSDDTKQKIDDLMPQLQKRFVRVVFKSQKNQGTCRTINTLYKYAKGKYIYQIASDDMSKPDAITKQVNFLENNSDYALVVGDNEIIDSDGKVCYWDKQRNNVYDEQSAEYKTFGDFLQKSRKDVDFNRYDFGTYISLVKGNYIPNGYLFKKSILDKTGMFTPDAPLEDWWFMLQISKYAKIKYIDEILFSYRWHGANTVTQTEKMRKMSHKTLLWEDGLANSNRNTEWSKIFISTRYTSRKIFDCFFIKFYKKRTPRTKSDVLVIFGHKFVLKCKEYDIR